MFWLCMGKIVVWVHVNALPLRSDVDATAVMGKLDDDGVVGLHQAPNRSRPWKVVLL